MTELLRRSIPGSGGALLSCGHTPVDGGKPSVVIALPLGVPLDTARAAFDRLGSEHNVVTWESRYILDQGQDFSGTEQLGPAAHVEDMRCILRALEIETCSLVGYCSGAGISLLGAKLYPEVFTELVLVSGEYLLFRKGHAATDYQRSLDAFLPVVATGRPQARLIFAKMAEINKVSKGGARTELDQQINLPFSKEEYLFRYAKTYLAFRDFDFLAAASEVRQRALVVAGRRDVHTSMESSEAIAGAIPGAEVRVDDQGDHYELCRAGSSTLEWIGAYLARRDLAG